MKALSIGFDVPFHEALRAAVQRGVVLPDVYYGELKGVSRQLAFSIAAVASYDQLQAVRDSLATAMNDGLSFREWKRKMAAVDLALPAHRLDNIWRTNLQGNYLRGQWEQFIENKATRGYLQYDAVNDSRTRPSHLAHDGVIRAVDDPFWRTHSPPLGYRCRCSLISLTEAQAKARSGPMHGLNKVPKTEGGVTAEADPGFDFNPFDDRLAGISRIAEKMFHADALGEAAKVAVDNEISKIKSEAFTETEIDWRKLSDTLGGNLSDAEMKAVKTYTMSGFDYSYGYVNEYLRSGKLYSTMTQDAMDATVSAIDSAVSRSRLTADVVLWRGIGKRAYGLDADELSTLVGRVITDKAYTSTSHSLSVVKDAYASGNSVILKIRAPSGSRALPVESFSAIKEEREVLLPRGTRMRVVSVDESGDVPILEVDLIKDGE